MLKSLFKRSTKEILVDPDILVKQIHDEVDSLEEKSIKKVEELLASLNIPKEDKVVDKAALMSNLGFGSNNETIKQGDAVKERIKQAKRTKELSDKKLHLFNEYKLAYPADKIIPFSEFNKVLEKYKLIYAPSKAYIKDVPEKNLLEIKNAKVNQLNHNIKDKYVVTDIKFYFRTSDKDVKKAKEVLKAYGPIILDPIVNYREQRVFVLEDKYNQKEEILEEYITNREINIGGRWITKLVEVYKKPSSYSIENRVNNILKSVGINSSLTEVDCAKLDRTKLFIAAPTSHFDMDSLDSSDGKEYFFKQELKVSKQEIKDPIAFYMLKGADEDDSFVRIVSKWGDSSDTAYLDPIVQDQTHN